MSPGRFLVGTLLLACTGAAPAQDAARSAGPGAPSATAKKCQGTQPLAAELAAEQQAVAAGDPIRVAATARTLIPSLLHELATTRLVEGKPAEAVDLQRRSLDLTDSPECRLQLASMLLRSHQPDEAVIEARKVVAADPKNATAWTVLGSALRSSDKESQAADAFQRSLELHAKMSVASALALTDPTARLSATEREQLKAGEAELRRLLGATYNDLGTAEARQQGYGDALAHFQQAQQWNPSDPSILRNLGIAAFRTENYPEVVRAFDLYFKASPPPDERSRVMLAYAQFSLGKFSEAATAFALARDTTMQDSRAAYSWAFSLARSGQQQQANHIADTLASRELPADVLNLVCHLYVDTEDYEQSASCYRKLLVADPLFKLAHYQVGEALIRLDRPGDAVPELRKELEISADDPHVQAALAFALLQTSQKDEARRLLARVTSVAPDQAEAQYQYGKLLVEDGQPGDALPHLQAAERLEPEKDYVRYQLQSAYRRLGRSEDAAREAAAYRDIKERHRDDAAKPHSDGSQEP